MGEHDRTARVSELLRQAAEPHHIVYRIVDGDDPDWATLVCGIGCGLSELPAELGEAPVRSALVHALVEPTLSTRSKVRPSAGSTTTPELFARSLLEAIATG